MSEAFAEFLLVDVGNTAVKLRRASRRALIGATVRLPTADLAAPALIAALRAWRYRRVVLSSVVPAAADMVAGTLPEPLFFVCPRAGLGVDLSAYPARRTLGADRLANVAGALALYGPGPLIVADFGTAATFNAVDAAGRFLGGVIAPGLGTLAESLHRQTAKLPAVGRLGEPRAAVGRSTHEAMLAGAVIGGRGLVREIIAALRAELGAGARVIGAGGDARRLAVALPGVIDRVDPDLTLHGLRVIGAGQLGRPGAFRAAPRLKC